MPSHCSFFRVPGVLMDRSASLTQGPVAATLLRLSAPMVIGLFSVIAFNLADTFFVARLGPDALAAMSFTFPVVLLLMGVAMGLGTGTTSVLSRAIGAGDGTRVRRLASDSLVLAFVCVLLLAGVGMLTVDSLFTLLGAPPAILPLIRDYMMVWYPGMVFLVVPMVANAGIRASGDTRMPALIMVGATLSNVLLDPLLIFGLWGFPRLELQGAAIATVIARAGTMVAALAILHYRDRLLDFRPPRLGAVWDSWKEVGHIALPATATNVAEPIALGLVTRLVSSYGAEAVAAWGAGSRLAAFTLIPVFALGSGLVPFVGQNWGAGLVDRVRQARRYGFIFAFVWGLVAWAVLFAAAEPLARLFSHEAAVVELLVDFMRILPLGFALYGIFSVSEETLNAVGMPLAATLQTLVHMFLFYIPLAYAGSYLWDWLGIMGGLALADSLGGLFGLYLSLRLCRPSSGDRPVGGKV
jgi:putative MATE family efflux protein